MFRLSKVCRFIACLTALTSAQSFNIRGRVLEAAGMQPVPGAVVKVAGSSLNAITGIDGRFILSGNPIGIRPGQNHRPVTPYLRGNYLHFEASSASEVVNMEFLGLTGQSIQKRQYRSTHAGWNHISLQAWPKYNFLGYMRTTSGSEVNSTQALTKTAAGQIEITREKLIPKSINFGAEDADMGDIVLEYPPRQLDVRAPAPYGSLVLFDGTKGKAAAQAELTSKWQDWLPTTIDATEKAKYTASTGTWKVMPDPEFPNDTNKVTLQSCCNTLWGYDDLQSKEFHGDVQIHIEFNCMGEYDLVENNNANDGFAKGSKGYCNSGVYIQSRYEVQIYTVTQDSTAKPNDNHNWMAAIVGDKIPTANPNRKNGEWQAYDITFRTRRYDASGDKARISLWWNGKLVHDNVESTAPATGTAPGTHSGEELNPTLYGIKLQSEGRDVRFRNIWIKKLSLADAKTNVGY